MNMCLKCYVLSLALVASFSSIASASEHRISQSGSLCANSWEELESEQRRCRKYKVSNCPRNCFVAGGYDDGDGGQQCSSPLLAPDICDNK